MQTTRVSETPAAGSTLATLWRSFRMAAWLGWQIESNWADPFLFAVYSIVKPLSGAAILVVMYAIISSGDFGSPIFSYMYIGNAFYIFVGQIMNGMSWAVIDDREHYKTLKYIYTAPVHFPTYLVGRSISKFLIAGLSVFITLLFGVLFLNVEIELAQINWPLLLFSVVVGAAMLAAMGMILAAASLLIVSFSSELGGAVAGALYLFSGAIFPLEVLPAFLRPLGYIMPVTYWLELVRRSLIGQVAEAFPTLQGFTNMQLVGILLGMTLLFSLLAWVTFRYCEREARERGYLDRTSNY